ncbi:hypothetical protein RFI_07624 [Reticulomyxa filosa]|uniref:Uncharacterized protein n=1 Tax=Reticulomyxa filosa TaxID=46433 RepID=X6NUN1_RETFI|nr:hypothetical protein RFI_07624 [Reticulomyxa filosa]|eukprot:ETO29494.1 hypothetical protein RFI_07624 [Reticulomyxa filosa]
MDHNFTDIVSAIENCASIFGQNMEPGQERKGKEEEEKKEKRREEEQDKDAEDDGGDSSESNGSGSNERHETGNSCWEEWLKSNNKTYELALQYEKDKHNDVLLYYRLVLINYHFAANNDNILKTELNKIRDDVIVNRTLKLKPQQMSYMCRYKIMEEAPKEANEYGNPYSIPRQNAFTPNCNDNRNGNGKLTSLYSSNDQQEQWYQHYDFDRLTTRTVMNESDLIGKNYDLVQRYAFLYWHRHPITKKFVQMRDYAHFCWMSPYVLIFYFLLPLFILGRCLALFYPFLSTVWMLVLHKQYLWTWGRDSNQQNHLQVCDYVALGATFVYGILFVCVGCYLYYSRVYFEEMLLMNVLPTNSMINFDAAQRVLKKIAWEYELYVWHPWWKSILTENVGPKISNTIMSFLPNNYFQHCDCIADAKSE